MGVKDEFSSMGRLALLQRLRVKNVAHEHISMDFNYLFGTNLFFVCHLASLTSSQNNNSLEIAACDALNSK